MTVSAVFAANPLNAQTASGKHLEFDVASIKQNKTTDRPNSNVPLGPGDVYTPTGGFFNASGFPLAVYIIFAYKLKGNETIALASQLPSWAVSDHFDIQARASGNPTKDDLRLMMQSLLADRFKLTVHYETKQVPVFAVVLQKPGKTGPQLRLHTEDPPCYTDANTAPQAPTVAGGFPTLCNGILQLPASAPDRILAGARNVTIPFLLDSLSGGLENSRPMIDQTGLTGTVDFLLEWTPQFRGVASPQPQGADPTTDSTGPPFEDAMREQLGLKLERTRSAVQSLAVDHIEHLSEN